LLVVAPARRVLLSILFLVIILLLVLILDIVLVLLLVVDIVVITVVIVVVGGIVVVGSVLRLDVSAHGGKTKVGWSAMNRQKHAHAAAPSTSTSKMRLRLCPCVLRPFCPTGSPLFRLPSVPSTVLHCASSRRVAPR
jgi:hypothetical protein